MKWRKKAFDGLANGRNFIQSEVVNKESFLQFRMYRGALKWSKLKLNIKVNLWAFTSSAWESSKDTIRPGAQTPAWSSFSFDVWDTLKHAPNERQFLHFTEYFRTAKMRKLLCQALIPNTPCNMSTTNQRCTYSSGFTNLTDSMYIQGKIFSKE